MNGIIARRREFIPLIAILLIALVAMVLCDRPLARGDGLGYFMWLDSIAGDGDMDLSNQAQIFAHLNNYHVQQNFQNGRWFTPYPYGSALLLVPAYWLGHLVNHMGWLSVNPDYFVAHQGRPLPYSLFPMFFVNLYAILTITFSYLCALRYVSSFPAAISALFLFIGTPMLYYATVEPFFAHVPGAFMVALTLYLMLRWKENPRPLLAAMAGLAAGMATLIRWHLAAIIFPMYFLFLRQRAWGALALFTFGFSAVVWHLLYTWNWMWDRPLYPLPTEIGDFGRLRHVVQVLFSGERGLFVWSPLTILALTGLIMMGRRDQVVAISMGATFLFYTIVSTFLSVDWSAGWSFGMRRMTELYPVFVIGLAYLLADVQPSGLRHSVWALSVIFTIYSALLFVSHLNFINTSLPQGAAAWIELRHQFFESNFHITRQVFLEHYGPWAWSRPGP